MPLRLAAAAGALIGGAAQAAAPLAVESTTGMVVSAQRLASEAGGNSAKRRQRRRSYSTVTTWLERQGSFAGAGRNANCDELTWIGVVTRHRRREHQGIGARVVAA
jgi:hypothetical protein